MNNPTINPEHLPEIAAMHQPSDYEREPSSSLVIGPCPFCGHEIDGYANWPGCRVCCDSGQITAGLLRSLWSQVQEMDNELDALCFAANDGDIGAILRHFAADLEADPQDAAVPRGAD